MPNAVQLIKQDHKKVASLFQKYQKTKGQEAKRRIADQAMEQLEIHTTIEEEIFYPAAKREIEDTDLISEALSEHNTVKGLIEELRSMESEDKNFDEKWNELVENVQYHVQEEESELLPEVGDSDLNLTECGEEMAERKEELMEESGAGAHAARSSGSRSSGSRSKKSGGAGARAH